jgi:hypothetical protein
VPGSTPTRLARVRLRLVTPPWVGDVLETPAPFRSSSRSPRASPRKRTSFELGRACPKTLLTSKGVAIRDAYRPTSALRTNQLRVSTCLVCSRRGDQPIFTGNLPRVRGLRLVLPPRGVQTRDPLRPETKERAPTGSGPSDASETGDPRASRRANRWVSRSKSRVGIVRPSTSSSRPHPGRLCRLPRFPRRSVTDRTELSKAAKTASARLLVKGRRACSIRDAFHRREPHTRRARAGARTWAMQPFPRGSAHVMRIALRKGNHVSFHPRDADALARSDFTRARLPSTRIRVAPRAFDPDGTDGALL